MLIILEGPDGAGKTTLAYQLVNKISEDFNADVEYIHAGPPTQHPLDEYLRALTRYRPGENRHIIIDRWHWGESVYPEIVNRPTKLDFAGCWSIDAYLKRLGALVVLVDQFDSEYITEYSRRGELQMLAQLADTKAAFAVTAALSELPFLMFNWKDPARNCRPELINVARDLEETYADLGKFTTYCGPRWPIYLLFGDVRHNFRDLKARAQANPAHDWDPAFVPFLTTSGHYLLESLRGLPEKSVIGWANACDVDDPVALWETLGKPQVAALGRNAQRTLDLVGVPHGSAPHPQFARRFHSRLKNEYGSVIHRAVTKSEDLSKWPALSKESPVETPTMTS